MPPLWLKPSEVVLTRLVSYIVVEVEKPSRPCLHAPVLPLLKESEMNIDEEEFFFCKVGLRTNFYSEH
eukprot:2387379-Amphidinium_carterae.1